ncbi:MAG TPA: ATP-binding protein [Rhodocyclaceae bacterium]|nr:ATP-binding protein [Rhodocyclaceae bacterium]
MMGKLFRDRLPSLRLRLLWATGLVALLVWAPAGVLSYNKAQHEVEELMDGHLAQTARLLIALVRDNERHLGDLSARLAEMRGSGEEVYEPPLEFQIGRGDGTVLLRSPDAPSYPLLGEAGYIDIQHEGQSWRLLNLVAPDGNYRVQVAQSTELREQAALEVATQTILPIGVILPVLLLLIYLSIRRGLRPLEALAADVSSRSPENLSVLPARAVPREVLPLVTALNGLLVRLGDALDSERRFTADAAHELRTPLAAVKVQTQVALMSSDPSAQSHALSQVLAGVDRSGRLVAQLLRLARLDPLAIPPNLETVDLADLAEEAVAVVNDAGTADGHFLSVHAPEPAILIQGDRDLLAAALRNLVDNAVRHTPAGCAITVEVGVDDGHPRLSVRDNGPGVPESELPKLAERFFRGRAVRAEGSGLGLAIVRRIAELHGARLEAANVPGGGLMISLCWRESLPPSPSPGNSL